MLYLTGLYADNKPLFYAGAMLAIILLVLLVVVVWRMLFGRGVRVPGAARSRQVRLGVVDVHDIDRERQLVLVRRDNVEHLIMIGGPNDVLIESQIVRVEARPPRDAGQPGIPAPAATVPARPAPPSATGKAAIPIADSPVVAAPPRAVAAAVAPVARAAAPVPPQLPDPAPAAVMPRAEGLMPAPPMPVPVTPAPAPAAAGAGPRGDALANALAAALAPPAAPPKIELPTPPVAVVAPVSAPRQPVPEVPVPRVPPMPERVAVPPKPVAAAAPARPLPPVIIVQPAPVPPKPLAAPDNSSVTANALAVLPQSALVAPRQASERFPSINMLRSVPARPALAAPLTLPVAPLPLPAEPARPAAQATAQPQPQVVENHPGLDSLEEEMAKLLGRPKAGTR